MLGPVFSAAFAADGRETLISTGRTIFRGDANAGWREVPAPRGAAPARAIIPGKASGRVYLAGWSGLYRSDDWGLSWTSAADGLPSEPVTALVVVPGSPDILYAAVKSGIWTSADGAKSWTLRSADFSSADVDALTVGLPTPRHPPTSVPRPLWAAGGGRLFKSNDGGARWQQAGQPIPEPNTVVHALAVSDEAIVAATDRGLYRSIDGGQHWMLITDNLPAHLEAGPLIRDPDDPASLYAGFSLIPYSELWQRASGQAAPLGRTSTNSLVEAGAFLVVIVLGTAALLRFLRIYYRPSIEEATRGPGGAR